MPKRGLIDPGLTALLELHGEIFPMDNGFWTKLEARIVSQNDSIPHGIRYSLTLHNKANLRILGYDNAHGYKSGRSGFKAKKVEWDHKHEMDKIEPYEYVSADRLLEDFWTDVDRIVEGS